jgi:hypothetical protein
MEPRALLNMNGNLSRAPNVGRRSLSAEMAQKLRDELVNTPALSRNHHTEPNSEDQAEAEVEVEFEPENTNSIESGFSTPTGTFALTTIPPATPTGFVNYDPSTSSHQTPATATIGGGAYSPTTPYYLTQGAKLVQMTCPPKQTGKGLFEKPDDADVGREGSGSGFPLSGKLADVTDEVVRKRLAEARRRTMGWRPRVASPLGR